MDARATQAEEQLRISDRQQALRRTIRALPQPMLDALWRGLDRHGDQLVAGRLFKSRTEGGCAVGVMLLELDPELGRRGRLRFWLRDRWRRGAYTYRGAAREKPAPQAPRVDLRQPGGRRRAPPTAGRWFRARGRARAGAPSAGGRSQPARDPQPVPARP